MVGRKYTEMMFGGRSQGFGEGSDVCMAGCGIGFEGGASIQYLWQGAGAAKGKRKSK